MGLTERHWFENDDVPENYEWVLEDAVHNSRTNDKEDIQKIIAMLKKRESVRPIWLQGKAYCGSCGHGFPRKSADKEINYCSFCGQAVKWSD